MRERRVLVVSPSFALRNSYSSALEDDGLFAVEAASDDELLWCLVAGRIGDGPSIDLLVVDVTTPGALALLEEVRASPASPPVVLVGHAPREPRLGDVPRVKDPQEIEAVRAAVERTLSARSP